ncbi:MAG: transposase, partial [Syntrophorhabdus sp.]
MARPLRVEFPGALYHVTSRGNSGQKIFHDDNDRKIFLAIIREIIERYHFILHSYCLMDNHYHLVVETPEGNLSEGMRQINGIYTQKYNRRHEKTGHVFQGRYKAIIVDKDSYLLELVRYVCLNPVRANKVQDAQDWIWSSYRAAAGIERAPAWLCVDWVLGQFSVTKRRAEKLFIVFVNAGMLQDS